MSAKGNAFLKPSLENFFGVALSHHCSVVAGSCHRAEVLQGEDAVDQPHGPAETKRNPTIKQRLPHDQHAKRLAPDHKAHSITRRRLCLKTKANAGPSSSLNLGTEVNTKNSWLALNLPRSGRLGGCRCALASTVHHRYLSQLIRPGDNLGCSLGEL